MANTEQDPAGNTHEFRAFANRGESASSGPNPGLIIGGGIVLVVVIVVIALLVI